MKNHFSSRATVGALLLSLAVSGSVVRADEVPAAPGTPVTNVVPTPRTVDAAQTRALQSAWKSKNWDAARIAIQSGADVNTPDKGGVTPLMRAADAGQASIVELMLQNGADPNALDKKGQSALHYAVPSDPKPKKKFGIGNVLGALGKTGALNGMTDKLGGASALLGGQGLDGLMGANLTSLLGAQSFDLSGRSGWTAIAGAALQGDAGGEFGISQLLSSPMALSGKGLDAGGWTNLLSSVKGSNPQALGAMGRLNAGDAAKSALWGQFLGAASSGNQTKVAQLMANPNLAPLLQQATTGLGAATSELPGNAPRTIISALVQSGAQLNTPDEKGKTPLALAQERGIGDLFGTN